MKSIKILIILVLTSMIIGGCKSKMDVQKELESIIGEYQGEDLHTYFEKKYNSNVLISSSNSEENSKELISKGMVLYYYADEKVAYGIYDKEIFYESNDVESKLVYEIPVKFDKNGYHVKPGFEKYSEEIEEIQKFKFMFERVKLTAEYLDSLELVKSDYNFELPSYSQTYDLTKSNEEILSFIKSRGLIRYGKGNSIIFSKGTGNRMILTVDTESDVEVRETFSYSISSDVNDYKSRYTEVISENE